MSPTTPDTVVPAELPSQRDAMHAMFQILVAEHGSLVRAADILARTTKDYETTRQLMLQHDIGTILPSEMIGTALQTAFPDRSTQQDREAYAKAQTELTLHWYALSSRANRMFSLLAVRDSVVLEEMATARTELRSPTSSEAVKARAAESLKSARVVRVFLSTIARLALEQTAIRDYTREHQGEIPLDQMLPDIDLFTRLCGAAEARLASIDMCLGTEWPGKVPLGIALADEIATERSQHALIPAASQIRVPVSSEMDTPEHRVAPVLEEQTMGGDELRPPADQHSLSLPSVTPQRATHVR